MKMIIIKFIREFKNKLINLNKYPEILGNFTPSPLYRLRNKVYTKFFSERKGTHIFYTAFRDKNKLKNFKSSGLVNKDFLEDGLTIKKESLPEIEKHIIECSIKQLKKAYYENNDLPNLSKYYQDKTLPMFKPLIKNYYNTELLKRFSLNIAGESWATMFPSLFKFAKEVGQVIFNKEYLPKDFSLEIISEFSEGPEKIGKINRPHVDRFFPAVKLIYSPCQINEYESPFGYFKKSHKIDKMYLNSMDIFIDKFFKNPSDQNLYKDLPAFDKFEPKKIFMNPNDLMLVATSGLHFRSGFNSQKSAQRHLLFIDFYSFFSKTDLFFYESAY